MRHVIKTPGVRLAFNLITIALSTPLMTVEPIVDHRTSQRFRLLAAARYNFPDAFNITGMNGYAPVVPFDPGADGVPYASVFHQGILRSN
jgi:hypothetical protein